MMLISAGVKCRGLRTMMGYRRERRPCGVVYSFAEGIGLLISIFAFGRGGVRRGAVMEARMDFERSFVSLLIHH